MISTEDRLLRPTSVHHRLAEFQTCHWCATQQIQTSIFNTKSFAFIQIFYQNVTCHCEYHVYIKVSYATTGSNTMITSMKAFAMLIIESTLQSTVLIYYKLINTTRCLKKHANFGLILIILAKQRQSTFINDRPMHIQLPCPFTFTYFIFF